MIVNRDSIRDSDMTSEQIAEKEEIKEREKREKKIIEEKYADTFEKTLVYLERLCWIVKYEYRECLGERISESSYQDILQIKNDIFHAYLLMHKLRKLFRVVKKSPKSAVSES